MVKFFDNAVTFKEVPNIVSRSFSITNCGGKCKGCHSPWLQQDIGEELTDEILENFFRLDKDKIECYVFLGDGNDPIRMTELLKLCKQNGFKTCLYLGNYTTHWDYLRYLDYVKLGSYVECLGGLDSPTTNQVMYKIENITNQFQNKT